MARGSEMGGRLYSEAGIFKYGDGLEYGVWYGRENEKKVEYVIEKKIIEFLRIEMGNIMKENDIKVELILLLQPKLEILFERIFDRIYSRFSL